jgi:predicted transcriptional regulator|tara:strand:- start:509 stop:838 length:330 start_codon:yes stop_codon:yes gene_type:complete
MARKFRELKDKMSEESQERASIKANVMLQELALAELRRALELSQDDIATQMKLKQPAISKLEKSTDMYLSTLRRYIEAMGGTLEIKARFHNSEVTINQFEEFSKKVATV